MRPSRTRPALTVRTSLLDSDTPSSIRSGVKRPDVGREWNPAYPDVRKGR